MSTISAGTTSTTALVNTGDTTGNLVFQTNGTTTAMTIDTSQRVGIGTSSPAEALEISRAAPVIRLSSTAAAGSASTYAVLNATSGASGNFYRTFIATSDSGSTYDWGIGNFGTTTKDVLAFYSGGLTERMRIDSSGNVGIGTSSPTALGAGRTSVNINGSTDSVLWMMSNSVAIGYLQGASTSFNIVGATNQNVITTAQGTGVVSWITGAAERARIDSSGNLLVGNTANNGAAKLNVTSTSSLYNGGTIATNYSGDAGNPALLVWKYDNNSTTGQVFVRFAINANGTANGQINANGASAVAFGTWSDARLKENIESLQPQLANICALRPVEFDYKAGGHQIGFIAQEMQQVYPDAVGENSDGMLTITGWGKTEARLVAAIKELKTQNDELRARVAALEGAA